jgi:hypothetical protein
MNLHFTYQNFSVENQNIYILFWIAGDHERMRLTGHHQLVVECAPRRARRRMQRHGTGQAAGRLPLVHERLRPGGIAIYLGYSVKTSQKINKNIISRIFDENIEFPILFC